MNLSGFLFMAGGLLTTGLAQAQTVPAIRLATLQQRLSTPSDTTYVVNFWATWCAPCVKELPNFEQVNAAYARQKVKVLLISMDYASQLDKKVKPFVLKHGLKAEVMLLNEPDQNAWIDKVDPKWSGALPFTLLINNKKQKRISFEKELSQAELTAQVQSFLK